MKSWKTTSTAIIALVIAVLSSVSAMIDVDPTTNPDWATVGSSVVLAIGLIFARDSKVTSEQAGAK